VVETPAINGAPIGSFAIGESIELSGSGFLSNGGTTKVSLGSLALTPYFATLSTVSVVVPNNSEVGKIAVSVSVGEAKSNTVYVYVTPLLSDFRDQNGQRPVSLRVGQYYSLIGYGFGTDPAGISLRVNGVLAPIISVTGNEVRFRVPPTRAGATAFYLTRNGETGSIAAVIDPAVLPPYLLLME
jgi:hypothetical protein